MGAGCGFRAFRNANYNPNLICPDVRREGVALFGLRATRDFVERVDRHSLGEAVDRINFALGPHGAAG